MMDDKKVVELINGIIDCWEEDTCVLSYIDHSHPAFSIVKKLADKEWHFNLVVTTILERIKGETTLFYAILYDIIPKDIQPELKEEMRGKIKEQIEMWIEWGKEKGYIE